MDNTPTEEADLVDEAVRMGSRRGILFTNATRDMYGRISMAASSCSMSGTGRHRFSGYPRSKSRCSSCSAPRFREVPSTVT